MRCSILRFTLQTLCVKGNCGGEALSDLEMQQHDIMWGQERERERERERAGDEEQCVELGCRRISVRHVSSHTCPWPAAFTDDDETPQEQHTHTHTVSTANTTDTHTPALCDQTHETCLRRRLESWYYLSYTQLHIHIHVHNCQCSTTSQSVTKHVQFEIKQRHHHSVLFSSDG